ncbi:MAG TPA: hypothetical protein VJ183_00565 [Chloroflexia bacterium]|nr:hypothetical protein [Chloroflexia bacterium]
MTDDGRRTEDEGAVVDDGRRTTDDGSGNQDRSVPHSAFRIPHSADPFDRLYSEWAKNAIKQRLDPPSRERWDAIVLRLLLSEDPDRIRRYKWIESTLADGLGADAYELWRKTPNYTPKLSVPIKTVGDFEAFEQAHRGSMHHLMESQGLGSRYADLLSDYEQYLTERKARIKRGQTRVLVMGCAGMGVILAMMLSVLFIILLRLQ